MAALIPPAGRQAGQVLLGRLGPAPDLAIVLGSGLAGFADAIDPGPSLAFTDIDPALATSAPGHPGRVIAGRLAGRRVWACVGRIHFYEGYTFDQVTRLVQAIAAVGCPRLILTNAAGGIRPDLRAGDWMLIADHVNLPGLAGNNPLVGLPDPPGGSRFVDLSTAYSPDLRARLRAAAAARNLPLPEGVYCYVAGPNFETPAEIRFLARIGGDAVGMSTVPEVLMARRLDLPVAALACIANPAATEAATIDHLDVLAVVQGAVPRLVQLIEAFLLDLPDRAG